MNRGVGLILFGLLQFAVSAYVWHHAGRVLRGELPRPGPRRPVPPALRKDFYPGLTGWRKWTLLSAMALGAWAVFIGVLVMTTD